jgi:hypothetical protein
MNKHLIALAGLALLLGGCAGPHPHHPGPMRGAERPVVEVAADGVKAVRPDPLRFRQGQGAAVIIWRLGADGYSFPANGIVIDGELDRPRGKLRSRDQNEIIDCKPLANGRQFQCIYRNSRPGAFKYTVNVLRDGKALPPFDPEITNME